MTPIVLPSGGALTIARVPVMPPAPGRFSTTMGWPSVFDNPVLAARTMESTPEPALTGRITRMGRCGAWALAAHARASAMPRNARRGRIVFMATFPFGADRGSRDYAVPRPGVASAHRDG